MKRFLVKFSNFFLALALFSAFTATSIDLAFAAPENPCTSGFSFTQGKCVQTYTGSNPQQFKVPEKLGNIEIEIYGAEGGQGGIDCGVACTPAKSSEVGHLVLLFSDLSNKTIEIFPGGQGSDGINANSGGGQLPVYAERYLIRGIGLIEKPDDIGQIILKEVRGTPVYVKNVAEVTIGTEIRQGAIIKNGTTEAVAGIVQMNRGANAREVVNRVKAKVKEINERKLLPEGMQIVPFYDRTDLVNAAMFNVAKVLIEGIILVVIVLFVFLGDVRSSLIVVATLILTPLITFLTMNHYGISANLMSLGGLAIAIGIMVDGSVVVVENTFAKLGERLKQGESKNRIVLEAATEVGTPVLFGVGIIILVFMPLLGLEGMEGKMFAPLALTIAIALTISLILSFTLSPVMCSYILQGGAEHDTKLVAKLKQPYMQWLDWCLQNPKVVVKRALIGLAISLVGFVLLGKSFIPVMQEGSITPVIVRAPNISLDESIKLEFEALKRIMTIQGVEKAVSRLGRGESPADPGQPNESDPIVSLKPQGDRKLSQEEIANQIREKLKTLPGIELAISQPIAARVDEMVSGVRSQVAVKIFGDDLEQLKKLLMKFVIENISKNHQ